MFPVLLLQVSSAPALVASGFLHHAPPYVASYRHLSLGQPAQSGGQLAQSGRLPPAPWEPSLLATLHSAPTPTNYNGGGDWQAIAIPTHRRGASEFAHEDHGHDQQVDDAPDENVLQPCLILFNK
ncbi:hypothetical protein ZWY2020_017213 [Hordeum vulgare]|nr:hypothetical protein ZWY2020_017213 [Hordeum vulgare]